MSRLIQVALCTANMPRTIRTFVEAFGFASTGGRPRWGAIGSQLQELGTGDDTYVTIWWLIGRQEFGGQIELFHHYNPPQKARPADWRPSDLGWTRFGIVVPDFDATLSRLRTAQLATITEPIEVNNSRRVCFREPGSGAIVEVMEEHAAIPAAHAGSFDPRPAVAYVSVSVSDLATSRREFQEVFGLRELHPDTLHRPEDERLWGLDGAQRTTAVLDGGDTLLELVHYHEPTPRPPAPDALLSDLGIMNVAMGYRSPDEIAATVASAGTFGMRPTVEVPTTSGSTYLRMADRLSVELFLAPPHLDEHFGWKVQPIAPPGNPFAERLADLESERAGLLPVSAEREQHP